MIHVLIWIIISITFGVLEGFLFHYKRISKIFNIDIHVYFNLVRLLIFIPLMMLVQEKIIFSLICMMVFPFFHDGFYYVTRKILSRGKTYPKGFMDKSTTTTAKFSISFFWRLILFIFGISMIFVV